VRDNENEPHAAFLIVCNPAVQTFVDMNPELGGTLPTELGSLVTLGTYKRRTKVILSVLLYNQYIVAASSHKHLSTNTISWNTSKLFDY